MRCLPPHLLLVLAWLPACSDDTQTAADTGTIDAAPAPDRPVVVDAADLPADAATDTTTDTTSCVPPPPAPNLQLFTQLEADLASLTGAAARKARVDQFISDAAQPGAYPVRDGTDVVLVFRGQVAGGSMSVAGTFNGWKPDVDKMASFPDTDLHFLKKPLGAARHEYKLVTPGGAWLDDPLNPHVIWDGIPTGGIGAFNSVVPPWGASDPKGSLERLRVSSPELGNTRDVFVYLPPAYGKETCDRYPVLLVNDGNESLTRAQFDEVARATFAAGKAADAVLVFVALASQTDRMSEYSCDPADDGPGYADFLCDTLAPLIDQRYRTTGTPDSRGIIGSSMGGLISYAALFWRNDCLRFAGAQSGSFFYKNNMMIDRVKSAAKQKLLRAYLDNGKDNLQPTHDMRDALKAGGYPVHHWEVPSQDHTWEAWQDRFDEALGQLLPPAP
jgi:enterochelin esterase-like enzyme